MSLQTQLNRVKAVHRKLFPAPRREVWMPLPVCLIEEDGKYYYANEEAEAIDARCKKLGIVPNVCIVSEDWRPDMDGCETA